MSPLAWLVELLEDGDALPRRVFHAPVVADIAEQQVAALLPPDRPFGGSELAAQAGGQFPDRLRGVDDRVQAWIKPLDPLARLGRRSSKAACDREAARRRRHCQHVPARYGVLSTHGTLPRLSLCVVQESKRGRSVSDREPIRLVPAGRIHQDFPLFDALLGLADGRGRRTRRRSPPSSATRWASIGKLWKHYPAITLEFADAAIAKLMTWVDGKGRLEGFSQAWALAISRSSPASSAASNGRGRTKVHAN